jgi:hypothetical protein
MASPNRSFVMVGEVLWEYYHQRRRQIMQEWRCWTVGDFLDGTSDGVLQGRSAARAQLDDEVKLMAPNMGGPYLVPIGAVPKNLFE